MKICFTNNKTILFLLLIIILNLFSSCGLKTPPQNIPKKKSKSTITNFQAIQKGKNIRLSWKVSEEERSNAIKKFIDYQYDNESERDKVFGKENKHYIILKKIVPKITLDLICNWYEKNTKKLIDRDKHLKEWYESQFISGNEKEDAFTRIGKNYILQDYFLIKEKIQPFHCKDCVEEFKEYKRIFFKSKKLIRDGNNFYYYLELPKINIFFKEYEIYHYGPDNEIISKVNKFRFKKANFFPEIPKPEFKIVQIDYGDQTVQLPFGKLIIKDSSFSNDLKTYKEENTVLLNDSKNFNNTQMIKFILRISWPKILRFGNKRLDGSGNLFENKKFFKVNLYRKRIGEIWPETPINFISNQKNYFLDKIELYLYSNKSKKMENILPNNTSLKFPFFVDLKGQNSDTWLYQIRMTDSFGNESEASKTIAVNLPRKNIKLGHLGDKN